MKNRYKNPWHKSCNTPRPEYYENDAKQVMEYRRVKVFALFAHGYDFVYEGCCITQRAGVTEAKREIDKILNGETSVDITVARHLRQYGHADVQSYEDAHEHYLIESSAQAVEEIGEDELERFALAQGSEAAN